MRIPLRIFEIRGGLRGWSRMVDSLVQQSGGGCSKNSNDSPQKTGRATVVDGRLIGKATEARKITLLPLPFRFGRSVHSPLPDRFLSDEHFSVSTEPAASSSPSAPPPACRTPPARDT